MKKILSLLGTITLIGTSTTSLIACNTPQKYKKEELAILKEKNKINTTNQEIRNNLEWIASQEKPFNTVDNKYYFVIWKYGKDGIYKQFDWKIVKFLNNTNDQKTIDNIYENYSLIFKPPNYKDYNLVIMKGSSKTDKTWISDDGTYFKAVYRWNNDEQKLPNLGIDKKGNIKINT